MRRLSPPNPLTHKTTLEKGPWHGWANRNLKKKISSKIKQKLHFISVAYEKEYAQVWLNIKCVKIQD